MNHSFFSKRAVLVPLALVIRQAPTTAVVEQAGIIQQFVRQAKKGETVKYVGLLVQGRFARRFLHPECKTLEIRSKALNFLEPGECIALVSCHRGMCRKILAILRFQKCFQIPLEGLESFQPLHCVTSEELKPFITDAKRRGHDHVHGWSFSLVHTFPSPPALQCKSGEVWVHFELADLMEAREAKCCQGQHSKCYHEFN